MASIGSSIVAVLTILSLLYWWKLKKPQEEKEREAAGLLNESKDRKGVMQASVRESAQKRSKDKDQSIKLQGISFVIIRYYLL